MKNFKYLKSFAPIFFLLWICVPGYAARIACVGTSITHWSGYAEKLGTLMGSSHTVYNLGKYGTTGTKFGDSPYWECDKFQSAFTNLPDLIIIELGTNDTKRFNWNRSRYTTDLSSIIDTFASMASKPRIWLAIPPPVAKDVYGIVGDTLEAGVIPIITAVAQEKGVPLIDFHTCFVAHPEWFSDGVHPDGSSPVADSMAAIAKKAITQPTLFLSQQKIEFTVITGQTSTLDHTVKVTNSGITNTLNGVMVTSKASWLSISIDSTNKNNQIMTLHMSAALISGQEQLLTDTILVASSNAAVPARLVVTVWVRSAAVVAGVTIISAPANVPNKGTQQFTAQGIDQFGKPMNLPTGITWSATGGTIGATGLFTADTAQGDFNIIAQYQSFSDTAIVHLSPIVYLPGGKITQMLVLKQNGSSSIPRGTGLISTNFLPNESIIQPVADRKDTINGAECVWSMATDADGMWFDQTSQDNFVSYGALYVYSFIPQTVHFRYRFDDNCKIFCNNTLIVNESANNDDGLQRVSAGAYLAKGVNRLFFKFLEKTGGNYFSVRIANAAGADVTTLGYQFSPVPPALKAAKVSSRVKSGAPLVQLKKNNVSLTFLTREAREIQIIDSRGKVISTQRPVSSHVVVSTAAYPAGLCILRVTSGSQVFSRKILIHS